MKLIMWIFSLLINQQRISKHSESFLSTFKSKLTKVFQNMVFLESPLSELNWECQRYLRFPLTADVNGDRGRWDGGGERAYQWICPESRLSRQLGDGFSSQQQKEKKVRTHGQNVISKVAFNCHIECAVWWKVHRCTGDIVQWSTVCTHTLRSVLSTLLKKR